MIMADVFKILFIILGLIISFVSYWLLFEAIFPSLVGRAHRALASHPWKSVMYGLAAGLPLTVVGLAMASAPAPLKLPGLILIGGVFLSGLLGSTALARHIGLRLSGVNDVAQPWKRVLRGGTVLALTFVLPLVGWFFVLPLALLVGIGALAQSRNRPQVAPAPVAAPVAASSSNALQA
ncbi:MAG: hypothetical protein AMXMBFR84_05790 [Candidatus Hydrogenedentota bacterium]